MFSQTDILPQEEYDDNANDVDVPVNKKATFHGRLNQYFHTSKANASSNSVSAKSTTSTDIIQREDRKRDSTSRELESDSGSRRSKRRKAAATDTIKKTEVGRITRSRSASRLREQPGSEPEPEQTLEPQLQPHTPTQRSTASLLRDTIPPNLTVLLVGVNPGVLTGKTGHAYAHPSNLFWKLLHWSGITPIRHPASDTYKLPELYNIGNTNIVERPTRDASMLNRAEMDAGVPVLETKVAMRRPESVCLVGKGIWEAVWRVRRGRAIRKEEFRYGWQDERENMGRSKAWHGARVFVATTTSGLAAGMNTQEKLAVWNELGRWVVKRRAGSNAPPG